MVRLTDPPDMTLDVYRERKNNTIQYEVLVYCLGGLSLHRKSVVRITDRPDMTLNVYHGRKTTKQRFRMGLNNGPTLSWHQKPGLMSGHGACRIRTV